ncbi:MAG: radical SAM protein [Planctomycetes bacterium]|nr:radical SAM protein [Planctomycetota bacterium]
MNVSELVIEITRRCNIKCRHCLRGAPQRKDISDETIDKLLEGVNYISTITFTGGEPQLAVDRIRYFTKAIKARGIELGGFYVITNGKVASLDLVHALLDLYAYVHPMERDDMCSLIVSRDQYHHEQCDPSEAIALYSGLSFFRPEARNERIDPYQVIAEGRAKDWGGRPVPTNGVVVGLDDDGNVELLEETVYVNVLGDVCPVCDWSYATQAKKKIGNVHEDTLAEIYKRQVPKEEPDEMKEAA